MILPVFIIPMLKYFCTLRPHTQSNLLMNIGYYCHSNIQHLPPIIQLYPKLGGILITTRREIFDLVNDKYKDLKIEIKLCKDILEAKALAKKLQLRVIIYPSFHRLYCGKSVQIFHGGLSDKRYLESARLITYDLVLFPGQKSVDKVKLAGTLEHIKEWHCVGYPKFDPVINATNLRTHKLLDNGRKTILYAPTWMSQVTRMKPGTRSKLGESSLSSWAIPIIEELSPHYNIIIKYHSNLREDKLNVYNEVKALIAELNVEEHVLTVVDDNIIPYMLEADLMISDISSVCYEWLHFDRPIVFANPAPYQYKRGTKITDETYCWQGGEILDEAEQIYPIVSNNLELDLFSEQRQKLFHYSIEQPDGLATTRQVEHILNLYNTVKDAPWSWFYLQNKLIQKYRYLIAAIFRFTKNLPR